MPNAIATLVLAAWPLITLAIFLRARVDMAIVWSLLLGYLLLPEPPAGFDPPLMPALDKHNIPAIATFLALLQRQGLKAPLLPEGWVPRLLIVLFLFSPIASVLSNGEAISYGVVFLPGHDLKAAVGVVLQQFFLILPFLLARQFLASGGSLRGLLRAFVIAGLLYSLLMLIEIRLSPQLNNWIYGYHQHDFRQTLRFGGYRPMVFLYHGIWVAVFIMIAATSAWSLWKTSQRKSRGKLLIVAVYLTAILVLAKSLGVVLYAALIVPVILLFGQRMQLRIALVLALLATAYPVLKAADLTYEDEIVAVFDRYVPDRAQSLDFRFRNETALMMRAQERPLFGWGIYGRNHLYDPASGRIWTVTDGRWIILIGTFGWTGYIAEFGLLLWPLFLTWRLSGSPAARKMSPLAAPTALVLAINIVDLLPNATLTVITWLLAGTLLGHAESLVSRKRRLDSDRRSRHALTWQQAM